LSTFANVFTTVSKHDNDTILFEELLAYIYGRTKTISPSP